MAKNQPTQRSFDDKPAVRERTPIFVGIVGPSATGKTFSALRLASGIQRVTGGETYVIDTEARRALHYADRFKFRHVPFGAPFSPMDYLAAIEHCIKKGAKQIIIDSMSHEHEGPGGVLEMHAAETKRLAEKWKCSEEKAKMSAWSEPKAQRRRLINSILQMECNFIFCFRAKQKLKIVRGQDPEPLGYMPIAGDDYVYEMTLKCLLLPGANGVPVLQSDFEGERTMIKIPEQFRGFFDPREPRQLSEDIGQKLALWAAGTAAPNAVSFEDLKRGYAACSEPATLRSLNDSSRLIWSTLSKEDKAFITKAADDAKQRIEETQERKRRDSERPAPSVTSEGEPPPDVDLPGGSYEWEAGRE